MPWLLVGGLLLLFGVAGVAIAIWVEDGNGRRALGTFLVGLGAVVAGVAFLVAPDPHGEAHAILLTVATVLLAGGAMALLWQAAAD